MKRGKYSLVIELKYLNKEYPNKEVCTSDNKELLEGVAVKMAQSEEIKSVVRFQSSLDDEPVSGVLGFQRNAYVMPSDKIKEI